MKLSNLLESKNIVAYGFASLVGLSDHSKGTEKVVLSSLAPSLLVEKGVTDYYALELPRGVVFNTTEDIIKADPNVRRFSIQQGISISGLETIIVSRHKGTVDILRELYPDSQVKEAVTEKDIEGKHVVGTLPPHLIIYAAAYTAATIPDFDYTKDSDLAGDELRKRLVISNQALRVIELEA